MSKDKVLRDWSTWLVRAVLFAALGYAGYWIKGVNTSLATLSVDVAVIKGQMAIR